MNRSVRTTLCCVSFLLAAGVALAEGETEVAPAAESLVAQNQVLGAGPDELVAANRPRTPDVSHGNVPGMSSASATASTATATSSAAALDVGAVAAGVGAVPGAMGEESAAPQAELQQPRYWRSMGLRSPGNFSGVGFGHGRVLCTGISQCSRAGVMASGDGGEASPST